MKEDNLIDIVSDLDFGLISKDLDNPIIRYASRGIVFDDNDNIAIINKRLKNEYKLPGGGIESNENPKEAFLREVFEETGCHIEITNYLGKIVEEKGLTNFKQVSYVFVGRVLKNTKELHLTKKETDEKTVLLWKKMDEALKLIKDSQENIMGSMYDSKYQSLFVVKRDEKILTYYMNDKKILK